MGIYINPKEMKKEQWLEENGLPIPEEWVSEITSEQFKKDFWPFLPVCLVDNGPFTAAGIGFSFEETRRWFDPKDYRPKKFYIVNFDLLKEFLVNEQIEYIQDYFMDENKNNCCENEKINFSV